MTTRTRRSFLAAIAAAALFIPVTPALAKDDDWDDIGDAEFGSGDTDKKEIVVSAAKGKFRSIKCKAEDADAKIDGITIELANGDKIEKEIRDTIKEGKESRPIALKLDRDVVIRKIVIKAKSNEKDKKTKITAYGRT